MSAMLQSLYTHTHLLVFVLLDAHEEGQDHIPRVPPHTRCELCDVTEDLALSAHLGGDMHAAQRTRRQSLHYYNNN